MTKRNIVVDSLVAAAGGSLESGGRINSRAVKYGDKRGDGRQAVGSANPITVEGIKAVLKSDAVRYPGSGPFANVSHGEFAGDYNPDAVFTAFDNLVRGVTGGQWTGQDYARSTAHNGGGKSKRGKNPRPASAPAPVAVAAPVAAPAPVAVPVPVPLPAPAPVAVAAPAPAPVRGESSLEDKIREAEETLAHLHRQSKLLSQRDIADIAMDPAAVDAAAASYLPPDEVEANVLAVAATRGISQAKSLVDLAGPAGAGKSLAASYYASRLSEITGARWSLVKIDPANVGKDADGYFVSTTTRATDKGITMDANLLPLARAIAVPNTVILLDEVSRNTAASAAGLLALFDGQGTVNVSLPDGSTEVITRHPDTVTLMARNEGKGYNVGQMDMALLNRRWKVTLKNPTPKFARKVIRSQVPTCPPDTVESLVKIYAIVAAAVLNGETTTPAGATIPPLANRIDIESVSLRVLVATAAAVAGGVPEDVAFVQNLLDGARPPRTGATDRQPCPVYQIASIVKPGAFGLSDNTASGSYLEGMGV